jgi:cellulose synthase/poly-beta-1,6-N-acetylglucosamine synthase-like glycosyltransferase
VNDPHTYPTPTPFLGDTPLHANDLGLVGLPETPGWLEAILLRLGEAYAYLDRVLLDPYVEPVMLWGVLGLYLTVLLVVAVYGLHRYKLVYLYRKYRDNVHEAGPLPTVLPRVTVQLPMYNEDLCAERIIDAACKLDWPRDRLDIQVLDDSTDHSAEIAKEAVDRWRAKGVDITYIHRTDRTGYKAGALAAGLKSARGEFVAIFDADFVPPTDLLYNVVPHFGGDDKVGMVQVRWDHLNRNASLLTKGQAIFLDGHFVIEHTARNRSGRFMHFNGTAGVWRRETIADAGGWQHDTLTEDLDLSYRAQLKGWQFVYLPQHAAPAELPPEMIAFKQQAHRWTKGSFQTAIKLLPRILKSRTLPWQVKTEAFFHLTNVAVYPLVAVMTLLMYPAFILSEAPLKEHQISSFLFGFTLFVVATCSAATFFAFAQSELFGRRTGWRSLLYMPYVMALGVGLCLNNTRAVFEAIATGRQYRKGRTVVQNEFVRTPKYATNGKVRRQFNADNVIKSAEPFWTRKKLGLPLLEIGFGVYMTSFVVITVLYQYAIFSLPFLVLFAAGYYYVGISSLRVLWRMHREQQAAAVLLADEAANASA